MALLYAAGRREVKNNLGYIIPSYFCHINEALLLTIPTLYLGYIY